MPYNSLPLTYDLPWLLKMTVYRRSSKKKKPAFFPSGFRDRCQEKRRWSYHCRWNRWRHVIWRYKDNLPVDAKIWRESTPSEERFHISHHFRESQKIIDSKNIFGEGCSSYFSWRCWSCVLGLEICRRRPFPILGSRLDNLKGIYTFPKKNTILKGKFHLNQPISGDMLR